MPNEQVPLTTARRTLGALIDQVDAGNHIELTEHGYPIAVVISIAEYRRLTATEAGA